MNKKQSLLIGPITALIFATSFLSSPANPAYGVCAIYGFMISATTGTAIKDVRVTARTGAESAQVYSFADGGFVMDLIPTMYNLTFKHPRYRSKSLNGVLCESGDFTYLNQIKLSPAYRTLSQGTRVSAARYSYSNLPKMRPYQPSSRYYWRQNVLTRAVGGTSESNPNPDDTIPSIYVTLF